MTHEETLAAFQAELLELLDQHDDAATVIELLRADPRWTSLSEYLDSFEPRMVSVATELVKKWGRRS